jgi:hypothetical protein
VHWKSDEDGRWCGRLAALYRDELDWTYLATKTEGDANESAAVERLREESA